MLKCTLVLALVVMGIACSNDTDDGLRSSALGEAACQSYLEAAEACYAEAGIDGSAAIGMVSCAGQPDATEDYFNCLTSNYNALDCSSVASISSLNISECAP